MPEPQDVGPPVGPGVGPAERELAEALAGLRPAPVRTTQRDVWFLAGVEAGRRAAGRWRAVAAAAAALFAVVGAGALLSWRPGRPAVVVERVVYVERERPPAVPAPTTTEGGATARPDVPAAPAAESSDYLRLRDAVVRQGLGGLPPLPTAGDGGGTPDRPGRRPAGAIGYPSWPPGLAAPTGDERG